MSHDAPALALPINPDGDDSTSRPILGAKAAVRGFYRALLQHGSLPRYEFFTGSGRVEHARALVEQLGRGRASPIERLGVRGLTALAAAVADEPLLAYHEPDLAPGAMFRLRQTMARRSFPITFSHHSFSYQGFLHEVFLRLLLDDTRPYDSLICSSEAARVALEGILDAVSTSFAAEHGVRLRYRGRRDVIPLGIDVERWRPRDRAASREACGLPREPLVILYLGRFSAVDKAELVPLVDVFARLRRQLRDHPLMLVLAGSERGAGVEVVEARARHHGLGDHCRIIRRPERPELLMSSADVFVSPSDNVQEAFGLTPVEAMASGVPQVVADWNGYRETVVDGVSGFRVPTSWADCDDDIVLHAPLWAREWLDHLALAQSVVVDVDALFERLRELVTNPPLRLRMAEASRRIALERFSDATMIERYEQLWRELAVRAARDAQRQARPPFYREPTYWRAFRHCATIELDGRSVLSLSAMGAEVAGGEASLPAPPGEPVILEARVAHLVLRFLDDAGAPQTLETIARELADACGNSRARAWRHVLWLMKLGLIQRAATSA